MTVRRAEVAGEYTWAAGSITGSQLLPLGRSAPWEAPGREDPDQDEIDRLRACAKAWREAPRTAARLGILHVTDEEIDQEQERRRQEAIAARDARRRGRMQRLGE